MICVNKECSPGKKLAKPKQLKGIKPIFSYKWGGVTACQVYIEGNDVWIKHNDWCSVVLYGRNNQYRKHYVYSDGFTAPVIKGQAYIRIRDVVHVSRRTDVLQQIARECMESRFCTDDERMFNDVLCRVWKQTNKEGD